LFDVSDSVVDGEKFSEIIRSHLVNRRMEDFFPCFEIDCSVFHDSWISGTGSVYAERVGGDGDFDFHA
jgi:hypothetical protein